MDGFPVWGFPARGFPARGFPVEHEGSDGLSYRIRLGEARSQAS